MGKLGNGEVTMAGVFDEYLIHPILELIRGEVRRLSSVTQRTGTNPVLFAGTPSVRLLREHSTDVGRVTGFELIYSGGGTILGTLQFGIQDDREETTIPEEGFESTNHFPLEITPDHKDYDYFLNDVLSNVTIYFISLGEVVMTLNVQLNYNSKGVFIGTTVSEFTSVDTEGFEIGAVSEVNDNFVNELVG